MWKAVSVSAMAALVALGACASPVLVAGPQAVPPSPAPGPSREFPEPEAPLETDGEDTGGETVDGFPEPTEPDCSVGTPLAVGFSIVDAALGHRYLMLTVRNCTDVSQPIPDVEIHGVDASGEHFPLIVDWRDHEDLDGVVSGDEVYLVMHWLSNGMCERGVQELRWDFGEFEVARRDCLQLGGDYAPERDADLDAEWTSEGWPT